MIEWTQDKHDYLVSLKTSKKYTWAQISEEMSKKFNRTFTVDQCRGRWRRSAEKDVQEGFKETYNVNPDGTHESTKLLALSERQKKDEKYILNAHGFDPDEWKVHDVKSTMWNQNSKENGMLTLYSSKLTAKKRENEFNWDKLIRVIESSPPVSPVKFTEKLPEKPRYLNIPLFDMHFGPATFEYYKPLLQELLKILEKQYKEILFIIGQDLFHNDDFRGRTSKGTEIDKYNMETMWEDAKLFYITLIDKALKSSPTVHVMYSKGNHDESMGWAFVKTLESVYRDEPRISFDTRFKERKAILLGTNFIGTTHGDKNRRNIASNFSVEFPELWAKATSREVYMGHLHRKRVTRTPSEIVIDEKGVIVRELGTGNVTDDWHDDYGYTMAHKEFEIFEYVEDRKKHIYCI